MEAIRGVEVTMGEGTGGSPDCSNCKKGDWEKGQDNTLLVRQKIQDKEGGERRFPWG